MDKPVYVGGLGELVHITKFDTSRSEGSSDQYFVRISTPVTVYPKEPSSTKRHEILGHTSIADIPISESMYNRLREQMKEVGHGFLNVSGQLEFIVEKMKE